MLFSSPSTVLAGSLANASSSGAKTVKGPFPFARAQINLHLEIPIPGSVARASQRFVCLSHLYRYGMCSRCLARLSWRR